MKHLDRETLSCLMDGEWRELDVRRCVEDACRDEALRAKWSRYHLARDAMRSEACVDVSSSLAERVRARLAEEPAHTNVTAMFDVADAAHSLPSPGTPLALDSEPLPPPRATRWQGVFGGAALAASVALATVLGLDAWRGATPTGPSEPTLRTIGGTGESGFRVAALPSSPVPPDAASARDGFSWQIAGVPLPEVELVANTGSGAYWTVAGAEPRRADSEARLNMFLSQHIEHSPAAEHQGMLPYSRLVGYDEPAPER